MPLVQIPNVTRTVTLPLCHGQEGSGRDRTEFADQLAHESKIPVLSQNSINRLRRVPVVVAERPSESFPTLDRRLDASEGRVNVVKP